MGQDERARGVVHIHSGFSGDGLLGVEEIASLCAERGLSFAALTDHAEDVDEAAMRDMVAACDEQTRAGFTAIPGLEHRLTEHVHILAVGQRRLVESDSTVGMLEAVVREGAVLVAAHCTADTDLPPRVLEILTAVEIWNVSRHTRYLPTRDSIAAYRHWSRAYPHLSAIGGLDMHTGCEWGCEVVLSVGRASTQDAVLDELRAGRFRTKGSLTSFGSRPSGGIRDFIFAAGDALAGARDARDRVLR